jgi:hypothetical protein
VKLASIISSSPVKLESLEDSIGNQIQKRIKISGIEASRVTLLMIPIQERGEASLITPVNEHKLQFSVGPTELHPWFRDVLYKALLYSIVSALLYGCFVWYMNNEMEILNQQIQNLRSEVDRTSASIGRMNIFNLKRVSDLSKELDFWRDTIRKLLYKSGEKSTDTLLKEVRNNLKTYTNDENKLDYPATVALAKMMNTTSQSATTLLPEQAKPS